MMAEKSNKLTFVKNKKTRLFTGCWACRYKKRKCDQQTPSCSLCVKHGCECSYNVKLTWNDTNIQVVDEAGSYTTMDKIKEKKLKASHNSNQVKKFGNKNSKSKSFTISDRRFKIYNTLCPIVHYGKTFEQKVVNQRLNKLLGQVEKESESNCVSNETKAHGPYAVFLNIVNRVKTLELLKPMETSTLAKLKMEKSFSLAMPTKKENISYISTSSSPNTLNDYSDIFEEYPVASNPHIINEITYEPMFSFTNSETTMSADEIEKSHDLPALTSQLDPQNLSLEELSRLLVDTGYLLNYFTEKLSELTIELKYSISSIIRTHLDRYYTINNYEKLNSLIDLIRWAVCDCEPESDIPSVIINSIYHLDSNVDIHFINLTFLALMFKDYNIKNFTEWLFRWLQKASLLISSNEIQNFDNDIDYSHFLVMIEFYICKDSLGYGIQIVHLDRLVICFKLLTLLSKYSSNGLKFDIDLIQLKIQMERELVRRFENNLAVKKYYQMELEIDSTLLTDVYNV